MSKFDLLPNKKFKGEVLHVGAHLAQEIDRYELMGFSKAWWIEGNPRTVFRLFDKVKKHAGKMMNVVIDAVVSDRAGRAAFNLASNDESSSLLEFGTHSSEYPHIHFDNQVFIDTTTINDLSLKHNLSNVRFLTMDVQGAELLVLRGATDILPHIDYILIEVNIQELYKDCVQLPELTEYLEGFGFKLYSQLIGKHGWGDAFYVRDGVL